MANLSDIVGSFGVFNGDTGTRGVQGVQGIQGVSGIDGGGAPIIANTQSGTYTLTSSDLGKIVCGVGTVIIPQNIFSTGAQISIASTDNNQVKIKSGSGVTLKQQTVGIKTELTLNQKSYCSILCVGSNIFVATGNNLGSISATGGTITTPGNGYKYHTFTSPETFIVNSAPDSATAEVLVVAGGGGGGQTIGGGGGAGGIVFHSSYPITTSSYSVTVGSGGAGAIGSPAYGTGSGASGGNSIFANITAVGGGGGGNYNSSSNDAQPGGSGGGTGAGANGTTGGNQPSQAQPGVPSGFVQYGNAGGESPNTNIGGAGGGAGGAASGPTAGSGQQFSAFTGSLVGLPALEPLNGFYGGGGGGGGRNPGGIASPGGSGGGGDGGNDTFGSNAVQYSGSGGGGGGFRNSGSVSYSGGNGSSGIVVIRYQT